MKKILCYGDSNTFGFIPETCRRYEKNERWSGILSELLGDNFQIVEEGMNNRTGFFKNPEGLKQSGGEYLSIFLQNHKNVDICILALGTNDAQFFYNLEKESTEIGMQRLIDSIYEVNKNTKIIIVPPVKITENILHSGFRMMFDQTSIDRIKIVYPIFKKVADKNNCLYFDFNEIVQPSQTDGIHYTKESHKIIAEKLAKFIQQI